MLWRRVKSSQGSLETAINTDLPGSIRAIVSRDVFPEAGSQIIVPKGSRLIGQYNSSILGGQRRVYVVWTRLIRPDGVDVAINSPLIDQIGQAGVAGQVDTKFGEIFSRALLTSVITISVAALIDEINGNEQFSQTQNTDGSFTNSGDATSAATIQASEQFGGLLSTFVRRFIDVQPTIIVDQGTPVNVFVNRDLIFPSQYAGTQFIP
jgi:Type IV secretory pathway, VirB10 components